MGVLDKIKPGVVYGKELHFYMKYVKGRICYSFY